jgi:multiple sugar transport system substrate-binding protein
MRKGVGGLLGVLIAAVALLVATAQAGNARMHATTVTLSGWSSGPDEDKLVQQVVDSYNATHKNIHIDYSIINGDYGTAMTARFAAHNPPDIFYVDSSLAGAWAKQGVLQPLNSYIKKTGFKTSAFFPSLLGAFTIGKQIYGFPKDWSPLAMEINKGMLGRAGGKAPTNWSQLTAVAQKMAANNVVPGGKPICLSADWARMLAFIYQNKASLSNLTSPAAISAVNYYVGLINKGLAATPDKLGAGWCGEALGKEKAAIIFEGNWLLPYMKSTYPGIQYGVFPMVKNKSYGNLAFTVSYSMSRDAKNKDATFQVLSWLTGPVGQKLWVQKGLGLPSRKDIKALGGRTAFLSQAPYAHGWGFGNPYFGKANTVMNNDLTAVISGGKSVQSMMSDVSAALKGQ